MSAQIRSPNENFADVSCDTCFMGHLITQNSMKTFIFKFNPRNGQYQVKLGQNIKSEIFFKKHAYLFQF